MDARIDALLTDIDNINIDELDEDIQEALMKRLEGGVEQDAIEIKRIEEERKTVKEKQRMLKQSIAQSKNRISELEETIRTREEKINKEMTRLTELNEKIKVMTKDIEARDERIAARDERIAARDERIAARDQRIAAREKRIAAREESIATREKNIAKDEARLVELKESISARQARIDARDAENARNLATLEKLKQEALQLSREIEQDQIAVIQKNLEIKQSFSIHPDSNSDEDPSFSSSLSDGSPSLSRKNSSSSDESLKTDEAERCSSPEFPAFLSSSAKVSASLPPLPGSSRPTPTPSHQSSLPLASQAQTAVGKPLSRQDDELKEQAPAVAFNSPEKDKHLVAKLGLNKDKSASLPPVDPTIPSHQRSSLVTTR